MSRNRHLVEYTAEAGHPAYFWRVRKKLETSSEMPAPVEGADDRAGAGAERRFGEEGDRRGGTGEDAPAFRLGAVPLEDRRQAEQGRGPDADEDPGDRADGGAGGAEAENAGEEAFAVELGQAEVSRWAQ